MSSEMDKFYQAAEEHYHKQLIAEQRKKLSKLVVTDAGIEKSGIDRRIVIMTLVGQITALIILLLVF